MNARTLRKSAIKAFRKYDFALAAKLFSLAYEKKPSNEFLLFIELCSLALDDEEGVWSLFDVYVDKNNRDMYYFNLNSTMYINGDDLPTYELSHNLFWT